MTVSVEDGLLKNDWDADDEPVTAALADAPASGTLTLNADGSFSYTPNAGFAGDDSFTYTVTDGIAVSAAATVSISVTNFVPTAGDYQFSLTHDTTLVVDTTDLLDFAHDGDDDALTISLSQDVAQGDLVLNADGSFSYMPDAGFAGTDSFQFTVSDGVATSDPGTVTLTVNNNPPVGLSGFYIVSHNQTLVVSGAGVLANDADGDSDSLTASVKTAPGSGTLTLNADGSFTYTPSGTPGPDQFVYLVSDGVASREVTAYIEVVNYTPQSSADTFGVLSGETLSVPAQDGVLSNDIEPDGDALAVSLEDDVSHGTLTLNADGSLTYVADAGFLGTDSFTYQANDGLEDSEVATVTIEVVNSSPVAAHNAYQTLHDTTLTIDGSGVLGNDFDWNGDSLTLSLVADAVNGTLTLNPDGTLTYVPDAGFVGSDSFTYLVNDGIVDSAAATVSIDVTNTVPTGSDDSYELTHDTLLSVSAADGVLQNDLDWDDDALSATLANDVQHGTLTLNPDGSFTYTPAAGYTGPDSFTYKISDGVSESAVLTVNLTVVNHAPQAVGDSLFTNRNSDLTVVVDDLLQNDAGLDDDPVTFALVATTPNGTLTDNGDGTFTYSPNAGFEGTDSFTYNLSDGLETSATVTAEIEVANSAPVAAADHYTVDHDRVLTVAAGDLLVNDLDFNGDPLTVALVQDVSHGALTLNADGSFTYTPQAGFTGIDRFSYKLSDGSDESEPVFVTVKVGNTAPTVFGGYEQTPHDQSLTVDAGSGLFANAQDTEGDTLTWTIVSDVRYGTLAVSADGSYTYVPDAGFTGKDSFTFRVSDGLKSSTTQTVQLQVTNTEPIAVVDSFQTGQDVAFTSDVGGVLANDQDLDNETLTVAVAADASHGTLSLAADGSFTYTPDAGYAGFDSFTYTVSDGDELEIAIVTSTGNGTLQETAEGDYQYTPNTGFVGTDTFTFRVSDGVTASSAATITIDVTNTVPRASNQAYRVQHGETLSGDSLSTAADFDGDDMTVQLVTDAAHGDLTLNSDGSFEFAADDDYAGPDSFTYVVSDGAETSHEVTIDLEILNVEPDAVDMTYSTAIRSHWLTLRTFNWPGLLTTKTKVSLRSIPAATPVWSRLITRSLTDWPTTRPPSRSKSSTPRRGPLTVPIRSSKATWGRRFPLARSPTSARLGTWKTTG